MAAIATPITIPMIVPIGLLLNALSAQTPNSTAPMIGTNILQVVSAAMPNNKMTVDLSGGVGVSPLFFAEAALITYVL